MTLSLEDLNRPEAWASIEDSVIRGSFVGRLARRISVAPQGLTRYLERVSGDPSIVPEAGEKPRVEAEHKEHNLESQKFVYRVSATEEAFLAGLEEHLTHGITEAFASKLDTSFLEAIENPAEAEVSTFLSFAEARAQSRGTAIVLTRSMHQELMELVDEDGNPIAPFRADTLAGLPFFVIEGEDSHGYIIDFNKVVFGIATSLGFKQNPYADFAHNIAEILYEGRYVSKLLSDDAVLKITPAPVEDPEEPVDPEDPDEYDIPSSALSIENLALTIEAGIDPTATLTWEEPQGLEDRHADYGIEIVGREDLSTSTTSLEYSQVLDYDILNGENPQSIEFRVFPVVDGVRGFYSSVIAVIESLNGDQVDEAYPEEDIEELDDWNLKVRDAQGSTHKLRDGSGWVGSMKWEAPYGLGERGIFYKVENYETGSYMETSETGIKWFPFDNSMYPGTEKSRVVLHVIPHVNDTDGIPTPVTFSLTWSDNGDGTGELEDAEFVPEGDDGEPDVPASELQVGAFSNTQEGEIDYLFWGTPEGLGNREVEYRIVEPILGIDETVPREGYSFLANDYLPVYDGSETLSIFFTVTPVVGGVSGIPKSSEWIIEFLNNGETAKAYTKDEWDDWQDSIPAPILTAACEYSPGLLTGDVVVHWRLPEGYEMRHVRIEASEAGLGSPTQLLTMWNHYEDTEINEDGSLTSRIETRHLTGRRGEEEELEIAFYIESDSGKRSEKVSVATDGGAGGMNAEGTCRNLS